MEKFLINGEKDDFEIVVGLEIHAQVNSNAKLFSGSSTDFGSQPNENVSLVDAAMPGMLPVINKHCIKQAVKSGLGLKAKINKLNLSNIVSTGGSCIIRQADIGELTIQYSQVGHDQNFATKELTISSTVKAANWDVTGNYEVLLTEPTPPGQVNP